MSLLSDSPLRESGLDSYELPQRSRFNGPVTLRRLRRSTLGYTVIALIGLLPTVVGLSASWQALGLGLLVPGGGFLVFGWWALLGIAATLAVLVIALVLWFATGNVVAPLLTWLTAAVVAAVLAVGRPVPAPRFAPATAALAIVGAVVLTIVIGRAIMVRRACRLRDERMAYLPTELDAFERRIVPAEPGPRELDETQAGHVRWLLGLGLQPLDQFVGFDIIEQFQPSALRYQLNHVQYALAQVQRHYTPNFHGYLSTAQERLIEKLTLPKVWKYWRLERLWGRFSTHYDPGGHENIMLTGWSGICLNTYHSTTGNDRFVGPNSLEFGLGNPKKTYRHDSHSFQESLMRNFAHSPQTLYACEPNWTYSACNMYGVLSVASHDAAFGTRDLEAVSEPFLRGLRGELMTPAGNLVGFRSDYTGIGIPAGSSLMFFLAAGWVAPVFPQLARTLWAIACREILQLDKGGLMDYLAKPFMLDSGNYRYTGLPARAMILLAAREFGDMGVAEAAQRALEEYNQPAEVDGQRRFEFGSTYANALAAQALLTRPGDWTSLITTRPPASALRGPLLTKVRFDQATVAHATSDGADLRLVLRAAPGLNPAEGVNLELGRLRPQSAYTAKVGGAEIPFRSDELGQANIAVRVGPRTEATIVPSEARR
jgi:linalool dehydratase/isomerase-like protein